MTRTGILSAIIRKDVRAFFQDRFFLVVTVIGIAFYVVIYSFLPDSVDETIEMGVYAPGLGAFFEQMAGEEGAGLALTSFESPSALRTAIEEGDEALGLAFPEDFAASVASGAESTITVFVTGAVPPEVRGTVTSMVRELAYLAAGNAPLVTQPSQQEVILGVDRAGDQVSLQETMVPMFAFFVLLVEMMALASLVASEIQERTVTAILATPATLGDFLAAKTIVGTALAFTEVMVLMALLGALATNTLTLMIFLLLGSVLVTGIALFVGSLGKDFISIVFWSMLFLVPLAVPGVAVLFPGTAAPWVTALPSWGLSEAIVQATSYGSPFSELGIPFASLVTWTLVMLAAGTWALRRKVASL